MSAAEDLAEKIDLDADGGGRARAVLLRRLIDVVALPASRLAPQDRAMASDLLLALMFEASDEDRTICARRLREAPEAPRRLLRYLIQCHIDIAEPLLADNEAFNASDLVTVVQECSAEHRLAIARRKKVESAVSDAIVESDDPTASRALLTNFGADLSERGVDGLVSRSQDFDWMCPLLVQRPEMTPSQALAMFWWSDTATRRVILQRHAADRLEIMELCDDLFALAAEENWSDPTVRKTLQLIERRQRNRAAIARSPYNSLEEAVSAAAAFGMTPETAQEIGYLSGMKPVAIAKIMSDPGGEGLAVLAKATGLKRRYLAELWAALRRSVTNDAGETDPVFAMCEETYDLLTVAKAQTALRYWNWSLSASYSPTSGLEANQSEADAGFSVSKRTARLVFGLGGN